MPEEGPTATATLSSQGLSGVAAMRYSCPTATCPCTGGIAPPGPGTTRSTWPGPGSDTWAVAADRGYVKPRLGFCRTWLNISGQDLRCFDDNCRDRRFRDDVALARFQDVERKCRLDWGYDAF